MSLRARDPVLVYFANFIESELGIVYAEHNDFQLEKRLEEIAKKLNLNDVHQLYLHSQSGMSGFKQLLLDTATNNETSFFRDPLMYEALQTSALPELKSHLPANQPLRVWCAACSTGQEPLSLAMLLKKSEETINVEILATDISERALKKCRDAVYSEIEVARGLSLSLRDEYFIRQGPDFTARTTLTNLITYRNLNLKDGFDFPKKFDLVFCRNVLIYQSVEGKISILNRLTQALRPGGYLILGFGESLLGLSTDFDRLTTPNGVVLYRKKRV